MTTAALRTEVHDQLESIGQADIIVGIPSYNNANTIGHVVRAIQAGLAKYFPDNKAVIVNSDGGSSDGTMDVVRNTSIDDFNAILLHHRVQPVSKISFPYSGIPGKGSAFRTIFEIADAPPFPRRAKADIMRTVPKMFAVICPRRGILLCVP